jgi:hypothetical protein
VYAYATMQIYLRTRNATGGKGDIEFLENAFPKLLMNFTRWIRKDHSGNSVFEGGFPGLDNIGVFDRSAAPAHAPAWNRPTAPPGWSSTTNRCCASPSNWRSTTQPTKSLQRNSSNTRCGSPQRGTASGTSTCMTFFAYPGRHHAAEGAVYG